MEKSELKTIEKDIKSKSRDIRIAAIEKIGAIFDSLPAEDVREQLLGYLDRLSQDDKWEVRKNVAAVMVKCPEQKAEPIINRLVDDSNRYVSQAAERSRKKRKKFAGPVGKTDRKVDAVSELAKNIHNMEVPQRFEAILQQGREYYEELAGDTAHALNSGLTPLNNYSERLLKMIAEAGLSGQEWDTIINEFTGARDHFSRLVNELIAYSCQYEIEYASESLYNLLAEAVGRAKDEVRCQKSRKSHDEIFDVDASLTVDCHRDRLLMAFCTIICNAMEAMDTKGMLSVKAAICSSQPGVAEIEITDTGCGMEPSQIDEAVKRFKTDKKKRGGIGLGLPIAKRIIEEEHHGILQIKSEKGKGTTVIIHLPLHQDDLNNGE